MREQTHTADASAGTPAAQTAITITDAASSRGEAPKPASSPPSDNAPSETTSADVPTTGSMAGEEKAAEKKAAKAEDVRADSPKPDMPQSNENRADKAATGNGPNVPDAEKG